MTQPCCELCRQEKDIGLHSDCQCHHTQEDKRPEAVLDRILIKTGVIPAPNTQESWRERFDALFCKPDTESCLNGYELVKYKTFIETEILKAKGEERERLREAISEALWNEDGSLKSHSISDIVSTAIHVTLDANSHLGKGEK